MFAVPAIFRTAISQNSQDRNLICIEEWDHAIIEHVGSNQCVFTIIELGESYLGIGVEVTISSDDLSYFLLL